MGYFNVKIIEILVEKIDLQLWNELKYDPVASNHGNLYGELLALVFGCYRVPHDEVNGTE